MNKKTVFLTSIIIFILTITLAIAQALQWNIIQVDTPVSTGYGTSIGAANQALFILHPSTKTGTQIGRPLKLSASLDNGGTWRKTNIADNAGAVSFTSSFKAIDTSELLATYTDVSTGILKFAKSIDSGITWTTNTITTGMAERVNFHYPSITTSPDKNTIYVAYYSIPETSFKLTTSTNKGISWAIKNIETTPYSKPITLQTTNTNTVLISYIVTTCAPTCADTLKFAKTTNQGTTWTTSIIDTSTRAGMSAPTIAALTEQTILISYTTPTIDAQGIVRNKLRTAKSTNGGTTWTILTPDTSAGHYESTAITTPNQNIAFVAYVRKYYDTAGTITLHLAKTFDAGNTWTTEIVDAVTGGSINDVSITSPEQNKIFISYTKTTSGNQPQLMMAKYILQPSPQPTAQPETQATTLLVTDATIIDNSTTGCPQGWIADQTLFAVYSYHRLCYEKAPDKQPLIDLKTAHDTCPAGYEKPTAGLKDGVADCHWPYNCVSGNRVLCLRKEGTGEINVTPDDINPNNSPVTDVYLGTCRQGYISRGTIVDCGNPGGVNCFSQLSLCIKTEAQLTTSPTTTQPTTTTTTTPETTATTTTQPFQPTTLITPKNKCGTPIKEARPNQLYAHAVCQPFAQWQFVDDNNDTTEKHNPFGQNQADIPVKFSKQCDAQFEITGCCPETKSWNGKTCSQNGTFFDAGNKGYWCNQGNWEAKTKKQDPYRRMTGFCPQDQQCLVSSVGNPNFDNQPVQYFKATSITQQPRCITDKQYLKDEYCDKGNWTTRTKLIAVQLLSLAESLNIPEYDLFCDNYENTLNNVRYSYRSGQSIVENYIKETCVKEGKIIPCVNNFCILKTINGVSAIGTSLNNPINNSLSFLKALNLSETDCDNTLTAAQFTKCTPTKQIQGQVWHNPAIESVIYLPPQLQTSMIDVYTKQKFNTIMEYVATKHIAEIPDRNFDFFNQTRLFNKIMHSKKGPRTIFAFLEQNQLLPPLSYLGVTYTNFSIGTDPCLLFKTALTRPICEKQINNSDFVLIAKDNQLPTWRDLTAKLRLAAGPPKQVTTDIGATMPQPRQTQQRDPCA